MKNSTICSLHKLLVDVIKSKTNYTTKAWEKYKTEVRNMNKFLVQKSI